MEVIKQVFRAWTRFGIFISNIISGVVLLIFYFTVFALAAIPFRIFTRILKSKSPNSNWVEKGRALIKLKDFADEF